MTSKNNNNPPTTTAEEEQEVDPLGIAWADPQWFEAGNFLETPDQALEYFSYSRFYDRQSNNEVIAMQTRVAGTGIDRARFNLANMVGVEFAVDAERSEPPVLWIIRKQFRESPTKVTLRAVYYILNSTVYQAPDLNTLLSSRLQTSLYQISKVFDMTLKSVDYDISESRFKWKDPHAEKRKKEQEVYWPKEMPGNLPELRRRVDQMLARKVGGEQGGGGTVA